jgi:HAD superfamily hydrolase (TIGR01450 family)
MQAPAAFTNNNKVQHVIFDLHGVIIGQKNGMAAAEVINILRRMELQVLFATNSSSLSATRIVEVLAGYQIAATEQEVMSAGHAMAVYLRENFHGVPAFFVGKPAFRDIILKHADNAVRFVEAKDAKLVIAGNAPHLSGAELDAARIASLNGARLFATSKEMMVPGEQGMEPGPGQTICKLEDAMQQQSFIVGKPNTFMLTNALKFSAASLMSTLIIGDNEESDSALGRAAGAHTILLSEDAAAGANSDWMIDRLELVPAIINQLNK